MHESEKCAIGNQIISYFSITLPRTVDVLVAVRLLIFQFDVETHFRYLFEVMRYFRRFKPFPGRQNVFIGHPAQCHSRLEQS